MDRTVRTPHLVLAPMVPADLPWMFELFSDPAGWTHFPQGRHVDAATTEAFIDRATRGWASDGLSYWAARTVDGAPVGMGGVRKIDAAWNLGFRVSSEYQGKGFATEIAVAGVSAAREVDPDLPVIAWIDEPNAASIRVAERVGLIRHGLQRAGDELLLAYVDRPWVFADE